MGLATAAVDSDDSAACRPQSTRRNKEVKCRVISKCVGTEILQYIQPRQTR